MNHYQPSAHTRGLFYLEKPLPKSQKPRKKGQRARDLAMRRKFVRGKFKDADDARRTIASLDEMKLEARRALVALHKMEQRKES